MKVQYFKDTDTLYIRLNNRQPASTTEIDENILLDIDSDGNAVGMTIEHARQPNRD